MNFLAIMEIILGKALPEIILGFLGVFGSIFLRRTVESLLRYLKPSAVEVFRDISRVTGRELDEKITAMNEKFVELSRKMQSDQASFIVTDELRTQVAEQLKQDAAQIVSGQILSEVREQLRKIDTISRLRKIQDEILGRLKTEIDELGRRANLNLIIGIVMSGLGFILLAVFFVVYPVNGDTSATEILSGKFLPFYLTRISIVLFVEVFAYFFLRLYRVGISDIRSFQNEVTSIELRVMAFEAAILGDNPKLVEKICLEFSKTERNYILRKGERTINMAEEENATITDRQSFDLLKRLGLQKVTEKDPD